MLNCGLKIKVFTMESHQREIAFIYTCIAKENFEKGNYKNALNYTKQVLTIYPTFLPANLLLSETYLQSNKTWKALSSIKKTWKIQPHPKLGELYMTIYKNKKDEAKFTIAKKLYKINPNNFESNLFLAKIAFEINDILKARKYAKQALSLSSNKAIYELLLDIENKDNQKSSLAQSLKTKIQNAIHSFGWKCEKCKKEHNEWHHECIDCRELDSIEWMN
jgi:HemY protein